jgi:dimethylsulfone monooxygenase
MDMFNIPLQGHEERYECAEEWLSIVKRLWTQDETFDHEGKFYKVRKGYLAPKPLQEPYPAIMNAGGSERGRHFACKHADMVYTVIRNTDPDLNRKHVQAYHALAKEYGRKVQVWSLANIVQGETEKEAREFYDYYVNQKGDWEAAGNVVNSMAAEINARTYTPEQVKAMREVFVSAWGGNTLVGTKEQIVDGLARIASWGLDGLLLAFPRYEAGMREFRDVTYRLVKQAGLRDTK